uniref:Uncharacterized protein n=1 Tax=Nelumbo nucifera TaxID=4432 RepID=A0A822ZR20_NELNU|nr:TPA_asm: hypothetical protein HUJ06_018351 [Nelumbo nucifera]
MTWEDKTREIKNRGKKRGESDDESAFNKEQEKHGGPAQPTFSLSRLYRRRRSNRWWLDGGAHSIELATRAFSRRQRTDGCMRPSMSLPSDVAQAGGREVG